MRRKLILPAAIFGCAIALGAGCTTEETSETLPPYASISDEARDPASAPMPVPDANAADTGGVLSTIGDVIMWPFRALGEAFAK